MSKPIFSIVVASYNQQETIERCIHSLLNQKTRVPYEVIVVDSSNNSARKIAEDFVPKIRLIKQQSQTGWGKARNIGIRAAKGSFIAFTDTDCVADKNWVENLNKAHQRFSAVGGRILNGNPESFIGWGMFIAEFCQFSAPKSGPAYYIAGCNESFSREIFDNYGLFPENHYFGGWDDLIFCSNITEERFIAAKAVVYHINRTSFKQALNHSFELGKSGALAVKSNPLPGMYTMRHPFLAPILFFPRVFSIGLYSIRAGFLKNFIITLPLVVALVFVWNLGICIGAMKNSSANNPLK
jgi:GT2 family glycosyltransferase